jgi:hypothetical protein
MQPAVRSRFVYQNEWISAKDKMSRIHIIWNLELTNLLNGHSVPLMQKSEGSSWDYPVYCWERLIKQTMKQTIKKKHYERQEKDKIFQEDMLELCSYLCNLYFVFLCP